MPPHGDSKVRASIHDDAAVARASIAAIDAELERVRGGRADAQAETVDERTLELLLMEAQAEEAYYQRVDDTAAQLVASLDHSPHSGDNQQQEQQQQQQGVDGEQGGQQSPPVSPRPGLQEEQQQPDEGNGDRSIDVEEGS